MSGGSRVTRPGLQALDSAVMLTLVLTRHGLTDRSEPVQYLGQRLDVSINDDGRRQAEALGRRIAHLRFDRVITSTLFRARETTEILAPGVHAEADPRLKELDYGAWEGLTRDAVVRTDRALRRQWEADPAATSCPGGESGLDMARRLTPFLGDLLEEQRRWHAKAAFRAATAGTALEGEPEQVVLVVGHATTNRVLLSVALGTELRGYRQRWAQDHLNLTVLRWETDAPTDAARLLLLNDLGHLRAPRDVPWGSR
jgi:broad specificity phosphatase PhoE